MNRKNYASILALLSLTLASLTLVFLTSCSSSSHTTPPPVVTIAATGGTPQSVTVGTAFAALQATVMTGTTPTANVAVTFTAPATTDGTFANGTVTEMDMTNASGVATSSVFTAGTTAGTYTVTASATGATTAASFSLTNTAGPAANLSATGGNNQNVAVGGTYASLVAQVTDSGGINGVSGVSIMFTITAGATGASGSFTGGATTETQTTDTNGNATVTDLVANSTTGAFTVTAAPTTVTLTPASVTFTETNTVAPVLTSYTFYLSGEDTLPAGSGNVNFYALAGAVTIDSNGNVTGGEQDYNNAFGVTSPQPTGDTITGGTLTAVDAVTGQYTLTLVTNNASVGVAGTETFAVQFVNTNHALISQFDGSATSSGSMDLQTLTAPSGGYAFTASGVDPGYFSIAIGGVFSVSGTALTGGTFDVNDSGPPTVSTGNAFTANVSAADSFGRGTITGAFAFGGVPVVIVYYIVGPEVIRIIDVDTADSLVGSAFGQGAGSFTNASLGSSVLAIAGNPFQIEYGALGQFSTNTAAATFSGVGDDNEKDVPFLSPLAAPISGTYSIGISGINGYGSLTISGGIGGGDVVALGMYMTDPTLNLNDPNNPTGGGGALVLDLDTLLAGGTGVVIPQTDSTAASFTGSTNSYAVGWQDFNNFGSCIDCELDFLALGTVAGGTLSGTGSISDPFLTLSSSATDSAVTFTGIPLADATNAGRYSMLSTNAPPNPLTFTVNGTAQTPGVVVYQASGAQLFWLNYDPSDLSVFVGPLEQQGTLSGIPAARRPAKTQTKRK